MVLTQIYLTEYEQKTIKTIADETGKKENEIIRLALDSFISNYQVKDRKNLLKKGRGLWKNRIDLPDFNKIRREWSRL